MKKAEFLQHAKFYACLHKSELKNLNIRDIGSYLNINKQLLNALIGAAGGIDRYLKSDSELFEKSGFG